MRAGWGIAAHYCHRGGHQIRPALHVSAAVTQRVDRPGHLDSVVAQRVLLTIIWSGCPLLDLAAAGGLDDLADLGEEFGGPTGLGTGLAPVVSAEQQGVLGAGHCDVKRRSSSMRRRCNNSRCASMVSASAFRSDTAEVSSTGGTVQSGPRLCVGAVAAGAVGKFSGIVEPGTGGARRGEHATEVRNGDDRLPFQALGRMHGEDLYPPRRRAHLGRGRAFSTTAAASVGQQTGHPGMFGTGVGP